MQVHSYRLKKKIVKSYLAGEGSFRDLASKYQISTPSLVGHWVRRAKKSGIESLRPSGQRIVHSIEFKYSVVNYYLTNSESENAVANRFDVDNSSVRLWVQAYQRQGLDGLTPKHQGRQLPMKPELKPTTENEQLQQEIKQLKQDLYDVKMERDVLKKLQAVIHKSQMEKKPK